MTFKASLLLLVSTEIISNDEKIWAYKRTERNYK